MTREEAKGMIKHILEVIPKEPPTECDYIEEWFQEDKGIRKSLDMAITALEQEPCEDAISRKWLVEALEAKGFNLTDNDYNIMIHLIRDTAPSVKPKPKTGHWIISKDKSHARCSKCNFLLRDKNEIKLLGTFIQGYRHCPYCGARMVELQESEET